MKFYEIPWNGLDSMERMKFHKMDEIPCNGWNSMKWMKFNETDEIPFNRLWMKFHEDEVDDHEMVEIP